MTLVVFVAASKVGKSSIIFVESVSEVKGAYHSTKLFTVAIFLLVNPVYHQET